ncbi:MAG: hypothetical protein KAG34_03635 [Cocleimonas sp.]|nr:hypothetical protein [Cocleimonas sp.]
MDLLNSTFDFIKNPENSWILYSIAAFMILDGFIIRVIVNYLPNILPKKEAEKLSKSALIGFSANLSTIAGIVLAIVTYYFISW